MLKSSNADDKLIDLMSSIPLNVDLANDFAENSKLTEESKYVASLLQTV